MQLDVHFSDGREVLNAYWGYLAGGGLIIRRDDNAQALENGQPVVLHVHIGTRRAFSIHGNVVRCLPDRTMIRFDAHDTQNRLLTEALAERDIDMEARLSFTDMSSTTVKRARLFVLSENGCGLRRAKHAGPPRAPRPRLSPTPQRHPHPPHRLLPHQPRRRRVPVRERRRRRKGRPLQLSRRRPVPAGRCLRPRADNHDRRPRRAPLRR